MICWHEPDSQCRKNHRGDGDLGFVFGRCRSGRRWFWFACTYGVGENRTDRGWSDSEEQTREDARIAITRIAGDRPAYVNVMHGWASLELKKINAEKRRARPPSDAKGSRVIEYLYGRDRCGGDCDSIYRFRITKRTAKRIFYIRKGEYIDEHGEPIDYGNITSTADYDNEIGFVDRQKLEADGNVYNRADTGRMRTFISMPRWKACSPNTAATNPRSPISPRSRPRWRLRIPTREEAPRPLSRHGNGTSPLAARVGPMLNRTGRMPATKEEGMRTRTTRLEQQHAARKRERFYSQSRWLNRVRKQVLYNAGYRCARCHADLHDAGKHAHVHHIIPLEHAPSLGFDLFNLEALCTHCHNKEHGRGKYGCDVDGTPLDPDHPWNALCGTRSSSFANK